MRASREAFQQLGSLSTEGGVGHPMVAGFPQQFAYSVIIVLPAFLGDCDVQQEGREGVSR
jgi:hypothetical protein